MEKKSIIRIEVRKVWYGFSAYNCSCNKGEWRHIGIMDIFKLTLSFLVNHWSPNWAYQTVYSLELSETGGCEERTVVLKKNSHLKPSILNFYFKSIIPEMLWRCILESQKRVTLSTVFEFMLKLLVSNYNGTTTAFKHVNMPKYKYLYIL